MMADILSVKKDHNILIFPENSWSLFYSRKMTFPAENRHQKRKPDLGAELGRSFQGPAA